MTFTVTKDHLKLLRHMYVSWDHCEGGAPCIDPKRPYGNSDREMDMAEILNKSTIETSDGEIVVSKRVGEELDELHTEMQTVLQIVLCTGKFKVGTYVQKDDCDDLSWIPLKGKSK